MRLAAPGHAQSHSAPGCSRKAFLQLRCMAWRTVNTKGSPDTARPLVGAPPPHFDHIEESLIRTKELVRSRFPELADLADEGTLVALPRSSDYHERRQDGYKEPELVLLVGTLHVSQASVQAVRRVIEVAKPDNVVLELCRGRTAVLYHPQERTAGGRAADSAESARLSSLQRFLQKTLNGSSSNASLLLLFLADRISAKIQQKAGLQVGIEMRAAREAAEAIGAQIVLGDRPIEITVERVWKSLSWRSKLQLLQFIGAGLFSELPKVSAADVAQLDDNDAAAAVVKELTTRFPEVASPVLHERDLYLSWSLKRSKAVNGSKTVVGVMGKGHIPGVIYHLLQDSSNLRFRDLAGTQDRGKKQDRWLPPWLSFIIVNSALFYILQFAWERLFCNT